MKTYKKPNCEVIKITIESHLLDGSIQGGVHNETLNNSSGDLTREKKSGGIGGGLWSDMN